MPAPYSNDLRLKVVQAYDAKEGSIRVLAERFRVAPSFVRDVLKRYRTTGSVAPKSYTRGPKPRLDQDKLAQLRGLVEEHHDATLEELAALFEERHGLKLAKSSVDRALSRLGVTRKKSRSSLRNVTASG